MGRTPCSDENGLKKGPWSPEEDQKLIQYIHKHGHGSWRALPKNSGLNRCGKSCRLRWTNYLRPDIKRGKFSADEEQTILNLHSILGNKWSAIATHLPGRTDNEIKNFWNTHLKKKLIQMGFDPMTHRPRSELYNNLPHLMAIASLGEIMAYQHHQLQQLQNLQKPGSEDHAIDGLQSEAVELIRYHQYLQFLLQEAAADQTTINSSNNADMEAMHLLALPSSTIPNGTDQDTVIWDTDYFDYTSCPPLSVDHFKSLSDQLSVSSLSNLQIPSSSHVLKNPAMNSVNNQDTGFLGLLHQEEGIQLKSPLTAPIVAAGSLNHVENNNNFGCATSSFSPELFFEEPFIDVFE